MKHKGECMNKILGMDLKVILIVGGVLILMIIGMFMPDEADEVNEVNTDKENIAKKVDYNLNQIKITFKGQSISEGKQKIVVWIKNTSKYIFSGNLSVKIKSKINDSKLGSDIIFIENLNPGQKTYGVIWSKPSQSISADYTWAATKFTKDTSSGANLKNSPYKFIKDKNESSGTITAKLEFFLVNDKDYKMMNTFIKNRKINKGLFYHAVFVDNEKYAIFSKYPITSQMFDEEVRRHIVAEYVNNTQNGYKKFEYYEKNSWESSAKKIIE